MAVRLRADAGLRAVRGPAAVSAAEGAHVSAAGDAWQVRHGDGRDPRSPVGRPPPRRIRAPGRPGGTRGSGTPGFRGGTRGRRRGGGGAGGRPARIRYDRQFLVAGRLHDLRSHVLGRPGGSRTGRRGRSGPGPHRDASGDGGDRQPDQEPRGDSGSLHPGNSALRARSWGPGGRGMARTSDPVSTTPRHRADRGRRTARTEGGAPHGPETVHRTVPTVHGLLRLRPCTAPRTAPHRADRGRRHRRRTGPVGSPGRIRARWR